MGAAKAQMERLEAKIDKLEALIKGQMVSPTPWHPLTPERKSSGHLPNGLERQRTQWAPPPPPGE